MKIVFKQVVQLSLVVTSLLLATRSEAATVSVQPSICNILMLEQPGLVTAFGDQGVAEAALRFFMELYDKRDWLEELKATGMMSDELRQLIALKNRVESELLPFLEKYRANYQLRLSVGPDDEFMQLVNDDRHDILSELKDRLPRFYDEIYRLAGIEGETFIIELKPAEGHPVVHGNKEIAALYKMYRSYIEKQKFARQRGFVFEILDYDIDRKEGRTVMLKVKSRRAYQILQFEHGVHRFIAQGDRSKTHTHYIDVRIYREPEAKEFVFNEEDIIFKPAKSSGPGGQHVNTTDSAVRALHVPTQFETQITSERSQHINKAMAIEVLRAKAYQQYLEEKNAEKLAARSQSPLAINTDRYVRTYNELHKKNEVERSFRGDIDDELKSRQQRALVHYINQLRADLGRLVSFADPRSGK